MIKLEAYQINEQIDQVWEVSDMCIREIHYVHVWDKYIKVNM